MSANPLLKGKSSSAVPDDRNPLVNAAVAREWARTARAKGMLSLAGEWELKAQELERQPIVITHQP